MLKKILTVAVVASVSVLAQAIQIKPLKDFANSTPAEIRAYVQNTIDPALSNTPPVKIEVKEMMLCLAAVKEADSKTYQEVLATCKAQNLTDSKAGGFARLICEACNIDLENAYKSAASLHGKIRFLIHRKNVGLTADQEYDVLLQYLTTKTNDAAMAKLVLNILVDKLPRVTKGDAVVAADLKKLNRIYSPMLLDASKKTAYEPIVAKIRTILATY